MTEPSDETLMSAYRQGQSDAFEILYRRHSGKVYGFLMNKLKDREMADDVFQATFLKLHHSRAAYGPTLPFLPWLFTICRNTMIDSLRKKKRTLEDFNQDAIDNAPSPKPDVSEAVLPDLASLSSHQREALELRYSHDLSFLEIAQRLNTSSVNVRQLISRAVKKLRSNQ